MRKLIAATFVIALAATLASAETYSFKLPTAGTINGTTLKAGPYKIEVDDNGEAKIFQRGELITTARVEVRERENAARRVSVLRDANGNIQEIRLKKQVVVFVR